MKNQIKSDLELKYLSFVPPLPHYYTFISLLLLPLPFSFLFILLLTLQIESRLGSFG
jgi:hypothetical protein